MKLIRTYADAVCGQCGEDSVSVEARGQNPEYYEVICPAGHRTRLMSPPIIRKIETGQRCG